MPKQDESKTQTLNISSATALRGALIGAFISSFISWNSGRYNRIASFIRRWRFIRYFVSFKPNYHEAIITNYHHPPLQTVANNFYCYAGVPGIGKSIHFQQLIAKQSKIRPGIYVCFKSTGRQATFQNDLAQQLNYGEDGSNIGMLSQIIRAIHKINQINQNSKHFYAKNILTHLVFICSYYLLYASGIGPLVKMLFFCGAGISHAYYTYFMIPLLVQANRQTLPVVVFDDIHKLQLLSMLPDVVRFLKLLQTDSVNVMLISTDDEVWKSLRSEPGMKDRLRIRSITYNHQHTCQRMLEMLESNPDQFKKKFKAHHLYSTELLKKLVSMFIGNKQMTIRRFISLLKLVDEEDYEIYVQLLKNERQLPLDEVVNKMRDILLQSQMLTMVSNLNMVKRELPAMTEENYVSQLDKLLIKKKLKADNSVGHQLKKFNITRDQDSQYIVNGKFTCIIYEMAVKQYKNNLNNYQTEEDKTKYCL